MKNLCLNLIFLLFAIGMAAGSDSGDMLVIAGLDELVVIHSNGTAELLSRGVAGAVFSPDGRSVLFAVNEKLIVMTLDTHATQEVVQLPAGARFGQVDWAPDGKAIAYEQIVSGKDEDLFLAPFPPQQGPARNLGHWYQGFSFSRDGSRIVHAVNLPFALEVVDVSTGKRTLLHKAKNVVWAARFSPDGKFIAYTQTVPEPEGSGKPAADDEPDCSGPTMELHLYSLSEGSDTVVTIHDAKAPPSVYNFAWSPDSRRIALELGTDDCQSPSGDAAVFVSSLDQKYQARVSDASPSTNPLFSPDGSGLVFVDSSQNPYRLWRYDFSSNALTLVTRGDKKYGEIEAVDWK
jgi:Tol biopolymer transport system component